MDRYKSAGGVTGEFSPTPSLSANVEISPTSLESLRDQPVLFSTTYDASIRQLVEKLPEGYHEADMLAEAMRQHLHKPQTETRDIWTSLLAHERLTVISQEKPQKRMIYIEPVLAAGRADSVLGRVEQLIDHFWRSRYQAERKRVTFATCFRIGEELELLPADSNEKELFKTLFKGHPQTLTLGRHLRRILSLEESGPPATIGVALDRMFDAVDGDHAYSIVRLADKVFERRKLEPEAFKAFGAAVHEDPRFMCIGYDAEHNKLYKIQRHPAIPRAPETAKPPAEISEIDKLTALGHATLLKLLDGRQRTLSLEYIFRSMGEQRTEPLTSFEQSFLEHNLEWLIDPRSSNARSFYILKDKYGDGSFFDVAQQRPPVPGGYGLPLKTAGMEAYAVEVIEHIDALLVSHQKWLDIPSNKRPSLDLWRQQEDF